MSLSVRNEWFDKKGRVFIIFTIEDVKRILRCADNKATRLLRELEEFGLIERKRRGQGKPCLVYMKNFSAESSKESVKNRDNDDSCGSKIACQDPVKSRGIKKKENKTEMNNTNLILSDESEKRKNRELFEEYFSHSLEVDLLLRLYPDDKDTPVVSNMKKIVQKTVALSFFSPPPMGVSRMGYGYCNIIYGQIRQKSLIFFVYL